MFAFVVWVAMVMRACFSFFFIFLFYIWDTVMDVFDRILLDLTNFDFLHRQTL